MKMKINRLPSRDELREVFDYEPATGRLYHKGADQPCERAQRGYWAVRFQGRDYMAHRVVWQLAHGDLREDQILDHINHDPRDNRLQNLRVATPTQNQFNRRGAQKNSTTGHRNVRRMRIGKYEYWRVEIALHGQRVVDELFSTSKHSLEEVCELARQRRAEIREELYA